MAVLRVPIVWLRLKYGSLQSPFLFGKSNIGEVSHVSVSTKDMSWFTSQQSMLFETVEELSPVATSKAPAGMVGNRTQGAVLHPMEPQS